jgi:phosphomannomutase
MSIFKAYDIRGKYPGEIDEKIASKIAKAFCQFIKPKTVVLGMDMRTSSEIIQKGIIESLINQGINVINLGLVSTPMFYFGVNHFNADSGIMITASHNPKEYNGLKLVEKEAKPINYDNGIKQIEGMINNEFRDSKIKGNALEKNILNEYLNYIKKFIAKPKKFKIVADYGNGMNSVSTKKLLQSLNLDLINLYDTLDGTFPNHEANPLKEENTRDLQKKVLEEKADLGVAFDGDGDRMILVDNLGERLEGDITTAIIAKQILKSGNEKIMYDLRSTKAVGEIISENNGTALMSRVGHSFIKEQMRRENAAFAGEISGHYYFRDNFFTDSTDIPLLMILDLLSAENKKLSEFKKEIIRYYHSGEISKEAKDKDEIFGRLKKKYSGLKLTNLDGLTFTDKDYWFNIRASNTESVIRVNLEANSRELMQNKLKEVFELIY